jgi:hypothetical protein
MLLNRFGMIWIVVMGVMRQHGVVLQRAILVAISLFLVTACGRTPPSGGTPAPGIIGTADSGVKFFCTFANSPTDCGFVEQGKVPGRATRVNFGRDGGRALRLHTEPGDKNIALSGDMERNDLLLSVDQTDGYEGHEAWWAHSILLPDDFAYPTWQMYVLMDFHNSASGGGQANFHINFERQPGNISLPGNLIFRGYGGVTVDNQPVGEFTALIGPVAKNVWYDFVYHVRWSSGADGFFDAWVNGVKKLSHRGPTLYAGQGVYLKLANYHVPVCNPYPGCTGPASSVVHDRIVRGSTWQSVSLTALEGVPADGTPRPTPDTQAPSVPTGLVGAAVSSSQIKLTWNPSTDNVGVAGYYVYLNNVPLGLTTATSFTHSGLTAGATYDYRVSAYDVTPNLSPWSATPIAVTTPPLPDIQATSVPKPSRDP